MISVFFAYPEPDDDTSPLPDDPNTEGDGDEPAVDDDGKVEDDDLGIDDGIEEEEGEVIK